MKKTWIYLLLLLSILSSCSVLDKERVYEGLYKNDNIKLHFINSKEGKVVVNEVDTIPFKYKIEMYRINRKIGKTEKEKIKLYVYRFTINANYELNFPLGFTEVGQKGGDVLEGNDGLTLVLKRN